jgi:hypothetical protein
MPSLAFNDLLQRTLRLFLQVLWWAKSPQDKIKTRSDRKAARDFKPA